MGNKKSVIVKLSPGELDIVMEALGAYKRPLRAKERSMAAAHGVNHTAKSHLRWAYALTAQNKFSEARMELKR